MRGASCSSPIAKRSWARPRPPSSASCPRKRVGYYTGRSRDADVDVLCASVQTLAKAEHLERFAPQHFDYVVVDEFHHAAAGTYRRLLAHFAPSFLLGLTATPDRTDQSDILSLCDDNLVYSCHLFDGITGWAAGTVSLLRHPGRIGRLPRGALAQRPL